MENIVNRLANGVIDGPDDLMGIGECLNLLDDLEGQIGQAGPLAGTIDKVRLIFKRLILEESSDPSGDWLEVQKLLGSLVHAGSVESGEGEIPRIMTETAAQPDEGEDFFASASTDSGNGSGPGESALDLESLLDEENDAKVDEIADPELLRDFIEEAKEHLSSIELNMLGLETNPKDIEAINAVFRPFHSIKGVAGFINLIEIHRLSHEVENLLDLARSGKLAITDSVIDIVLGATDILKGLLDELENGEGARKDPSPFVLSFMEKVRNFSGDPVVDCEIPEN
jgi:two-component system chemotaxis sensor kinase CheA